jgi:hypothetical protein
MVQQDRPAAAAAAAVALGLNLKDAGNPVHVHLACVRKPVDL